MAPCWPTLTLISVLATLSLKSKFLSFSTDGARRKKILPSKAPNIDLLRPKRKHQATAQGNSLSEQPMIPQLSYFRSLPSADLLQCLLTYPDLAEFRWILSPLTEYSGRN